MPTLMSWTDHHGHFVIDVKELIITPNQESTWGRRDVFSGEKWVIKIQAWLSHKDLYQKLRQGSLTHGLLERYN